MTPDPLDDERRWAADKRDFVADRRDDIAAERDTVADARDAAADERERLADVRAALLDERERRGDVHAAAQGLPLARPSAEPDEPVREHDDGRRSRRQAARERDDHRAERDAAAAARGEAATRREAAQPSTMLAKVFAEIAEHLYAADNVDDVLLQVAEAAVSTVAGCRMASITVGEAGAFRTVASTDPAASATDDAQYQAHQGPCLTAIDEPVVYAPSFPDRRWPQLASRPLEFGVQSAVSYRLAGANATAHSSLAGSMNLYAVTADAFNDDARTIGLILAAHASVAARVVHDRVTLEQRGQHLRVALSSRDEIGQAKGIMMERLKITPEAAFDQLRRSSQRLNQKLRDVAARLTETGEIDEPGPR
ncbi:ANTAR domain-containing protein [Geodermatophilus sp. YIM 151500]|uniref:ANTAR domain-containing protein n=1 Tax=Geodermatophilus sp. YIM 151500 TaxID=2984531 RepID=UPI0021E435DC|nr:ANTAR domain-containing protein [Geodermatophilus sp. YIM 151500]MCV2491903.1 ANTAR domain-containing protein [Geodermatophilus sp. YIM 151500]